MDTSLKRRDYHKYYWKKGEKIRTILFCAGITGVLAYFFYRSFLALIPLSGIGLLAFGRVRGLKAERIREELAVQFRECILAVATSLQAGYSVENAFLRAGEELKLLYGKETDIQKEICNLKHLLTNNVPLEKILWDFGERSGGKDIQNFADVFAAGKRSGGDLREMIGSCCEIIVMRRDTEREIRTLIHGKMTEQKIMCCVPFGIIGYISISSPGYFAPLYHNTGGICIMTLCLILYLFAVRMSLSIVRIEV